MQVRKLNELAQCATPPSIGPVGVWTGFLVATAVSAPRSALLVLLAIVFLILTMQHRIHPTAWASFRPSGATLPLLALTVWALITCAWAIAPLESASKVLLLILVIVAAQIGIKSAQALPAQSRAGLAIGLLWSLTLTGALLAFELWSGHFIYRTVMETFPSLQQSERYLKLQSRLATPIDINEMNRRVCTWSLLLWSAILALKTLASRRATLFFAGSLTILAVLILIKTTHQSSQIAALVGLGLLAIHVFSTRASFGCAIAMWSAAVLLMVPAASLAYEKGLSRAAWLPHSARARVALWGYTADEVKKQPFLGIGANDTPSVHKTLPKPDDANRSDFYVARTPGAHSHNFYLQVWYELGAVGASLLLLAGLSLVQQIRRIDVASQGVVLAGFASAATMISTSFGLWQLWFQAALALAALALIAIRP